MLDQIATHHVSVVPVLQSYLDEPADHNFYRHQVSFLLDVYLWGECSYFSDEELELLRKQTILVQEGA
jgi:hypothetical protein